MTDHAYGLTGAERAVARATMRLMDLRPSAEHTVSPHQRLAAALDAFAEAKADALLDTIPVVSLDQWATQHAPDLIADAEAASGVSHHTTRARGARRVTAAGLRHGYRP